MKQLRSLEDENLMQMSQVLLCALHSPPFQGGVAATFKQMLRSHLISGADGVVDQFDNRSLKTTPSAPLRNGTIFLLAQPPLLGKEGTGALEKHACRSEAKPR